MNIENDISIDIETLGTSPTSRILQIGACNLSQTRNYVAYLDWSSQKDRKVDAKTVAWWKAQDSELKDTVFGGDLPLGRALSEMCYWFKAVDAQLVWANSPSFDLIILEDALKSVPLLAPWKFYNARDYRTLAALAKEVGYKPSKRNSNVKHDALGDARYQANEIIRMRTFLTNSYTVEEGVEQ